jgi:hypothetical protein
MSGTDSILDLEILAANDALVDPNGLLQATDTSRIESVRATRKAIAPDTGTVLLYAVDKDSQPLAKSKTRREMDAPEHMIGLGVIFPHAPSEEQGEFVAADVQPPIVDDEPSESTDWQDTEGDFTHPEAE